MVVITGLGVANVLDFIEVDWVFSPSIIWLLPPMHIALPWFRYRGLGHRVREHDLLVRRGILTHQYIAIPLARIQQVDTSSGPLERRLGLTSLVVRTAGSRAGRTRISGLPTARATELRDELSRKGHELAE